MRDGSTNKVEKRKAAKRSMEKSSPEFSGRLAQRRGDYGFDAPYVPALFLLIGLALLVSGLLALLLWQSRIFGSIDLLVGLYLLLSGASYIYTTRRGKFQVWAELLSRLNLRGDEQILDLGTGRGAVLLIAAAVLQEGKATGVDIWKSRDQSGNAPSATQQNVEREDVAERIELFTADMRQLPSPTTLLIWCSPVSPSIILRRAKLARQPWTKQYASSNQVADCSSPILERHAATPNTCVRSPEGQGSKTYAILFWNRCVGTVWG